MEEAQFVRLRCCVRRRKYLAADDDGWGIVLSGQRVAHNTVWAVEDYVPCDPAGASAATSPPADGAATGASASASASPAPPAQAASPRASSASPVAAGSSESPESPLRDPSPDAGEDDAFEGPFFLLRGAYGRYLLATDHQASTGPSHGVYVVQNGDHSHHPTPAGMLWQAVPRRDSFVIRNSTGRYLRANGRYLRWRNTVTVADDTSSSMMQWFVEVVPLRLDRPTLLDPPAQLIHRNRLPATEEEVSRVIRYVHADAGGNYSDEDWKTLQVSSNSLMQLRVVLANRLGHNWDALHTTICVRAGNLAQLSPLLIDLPIGNDTIDVVVLSHRTPVDNDLVYPDVDATEISETESPRPTTREILARYFRICTRFKLTSEQSD